MYPLSLLHEFDWSESHGPWVIWKQLPAGRMCDDVSERSNSLMCDGRETRELWLKVSSKLLQNVDPVLDSCLVDVDGGSTLCQHWKNK